MEVLREILFTTPVVRLSVSIAASADVTKLLDRCMENNKQQEELRIEF